MCYSLKDGGHIFIDVPNIKENIKAGSFGVFFHQHISYFSKNTITSILNNYGFKVLKIFEEILIFLFMHKKILLEIN